MKNERYLKYCPKLNKLTGSVTSSLLLCQLEYWFEKMKGECFYKFLEPCQHYAYKTGDSWVEELGFSKAEFRHAFSLIGKVYKSKKAYLESKDPFEGKLYLSYYDRIKKITYYIRNTTLTQEFLRNALSASGYSEKLPSKKLIITKQEEEISCEQLLELFKTYCPSLSHTHSLAKRIQKHLGALYTVLKRQGKTIQETLIKAFKQVEASDFLCGRLSSSYWCATLEWILSPQKFFKVLSGTYAPYRSSSSYKRSIPRPTSVFHRMELHHFDLDLLEARERERLYAAHNDL